MNLKKTLQHGGAQLACAVACAAVAAGLPVASAQTQAVASDGAALVLQKTLQGQVSVAGQRVTLQVPAGQVVQLRLQAADVHLDLRNAQGQHVRRLAQAGRGVQTAMWHSQGAQHEQLWLSPATTGAQAA